MSTFVGCVGHHKPRLRGGLGGPSAYQCSGSTGRGGRASPGQLVGSNLSGLLGRHCQDLEVYRLGGRAVLHGLPLYEQRTGVFGFTYPPVAALAVSPLVSMPFGMASAALAAASLISLVVVMAYSAGELWDRVRAKPSVWATVALVALVCCAPVRGTFWNGQVNLILAAMVLSDVQGRRLRGVGVGLAAAIKLTPLVFVVYRPLSAGVGRRSTRWVVSWRSWQRRG